MATFEHQEADQQEKSHISDQNNSQDTYKEEIQRTPTPINQLSGYHDKENNAQRLEAIKDYLKNDNQFESVPEEIEAENREESDLENSIRSPM